MKRAVILSYGGGRQTVCILVLVAQGKLPKPELAIMADTGRERSSTWQYLEQYTKPLMDELGIHFEIADHDLANVDLYGHNGDLLLPVFTQTGKLPTFCSDEWKKLVVRRKLRKLGYGPERPVLNWIGFSLDEVHRAKQSDKKWIENWWPLLFDYKMRSHECVLEVERFGWPAPPESCCWMCPNMSNRQWLDIKKNYPADFEAAVKVDYDTRENDNQGGVYLHRDLIPLDEVDFTADEPPNLLSECASVCWT